MNYKRFKLASFDSKKWFWVLIYESPEQMRLDTIKFDEKTGKIPLPMDDCLGICQPYERVKVDENGVETICHNIGIIRFIKKNLSTMIVAHEVVHAALWNYRLENGGNADFGDNCGEKEEKFAHLYGQLFRNCINKLYKKGFW